MARRLVVSGYYGCGNLGDEAVLAGIGASFRRQAKPGAIEIVPLSADPDATQRLHGLRAVPRMRPGEVLSALRTSDALLSGGGSLLQDVTSARSLLYYLFVMRCAHALRKPVVFYAQGIGPLNRSSSRRLVRAAAERAALITVRDQASAELLASIGVTRSVAVVADPAFALAAPPAANQAPGVVLVPRPWAGEQGEVAALELVRALAVALGDVPLNLLPMDAHLDAPMTARLAAAVPGTRAMPPPASPTDALAVLGGAQVVVGMRLHGLILAMRAARPVIALSYDPKVAGLMAEAGNGDACYPWPEVDVAEACGAVLREIANSDGASEHLTERAARLEERAIRAADLVLELLGEPPVAGSGRAL